MDWVISQSGVPIQLTEERWVHIVEGYYDVVLDTVENPDVILKRYGGALIAVRRLGWRRYLAVVYREVSQEEGFIITAYFTSRIARRSILWRKGQQWRKR